ncbi:hypothetical protein D3C85_1856440 [compost metagenome]
MQVPVLVKRQQEAVGVGGYAQAEHVCSGIMPVQDILQHPGQRRFILPAVKGIPVHACRFKYVPG